LTEESQPLIAVWQKWLFRSPQTHFWLIKHWFSASTFVVKITTFAKPQTVVDTLKNDRVTKTVDKLDSKTEREKFKNRKFA